MLGTPGEQGWDEMRRTSWRQWPGLIAKQDSLVLCHASVARMTCGPWFRTLATTLEVKAWVVMGLSQALCSRIPDLPLFSFWLETS